MSAFYRTSTDRLNSKEAAGLRGLPTESPSRCELAYKRHRTDHDSADESKAKYSTVPSNSRTPEQFCDFRTQQSSSGPNREAPRSKHDNNRSSASLLERSKHREDTLTRRSLESIQNSAPVQPKNDDSKLDQDAEALPSNATVNADEISARDAPRYSLSKEKSLNGIEEELTDCITPGKKVMGMRRNDETNCTRFSSTTGSLDMPVETSDNIFCNNKLDLSSGSITSRSKTCPEDAVSKNVVVATSTQLTQTSQCTDRCTNTRLTQKMNIDYKAGVKRKLALNEDNALPKKIKNETDTLADMNTTIGDIQISNNNERSVHDESTENEQVTKVKEWQILQRRNKRYTKNRRDMRELGNRGVTKTLEDIRKVFRSLFGEDITKSESEEERTLLKFKYVRQEKSIDSCSTEARDSSDDDNMSGCKGDVHTPVDDSRKSPVKMECKMNPLAADTKNVIGKSGIPMEVSVAKTDAQEATRVAKVDMEEYISKSEVRELLWTLQRNLTKAVRTIFKKVERNDKWSSEVKQMLREIRKCDSDESSFSSDKNVNVHKGTNSILFDMFPTKLIAGIKDKELNDSCNSVNLTLMKNDISSGNTNTMTVDRAELMPKERGVRGDGTCMMSVEGQTSCVDSVSVNSFTNIDNTLSSEDDASNASTVIVNRSSILTSSKENICGDEVHNVDDDFCMDTSAHQSPTNTDNTSSSRDNTSDTDNEIQLEIKIKTKSGSTSKTFMLNISPSMRAKCFDDLKNDVCHKILELTSDVTTGANANRAEKDDASKGALNTNQVAATKNIEAMSSIQQVSCDSDRATQSSIDHSLPKETFQDNLRFINDKENTMERNEAENDQCVQAVERESMPASSISAENNTESSASVYDVVPSLEKSSPSESKEQNDATMQSGWNPLTSVNLTAPVTSDTTGSVTTVAPQVSQVSPLTSTSFVTSTAASSSATTCTSIGNLYDQHNSILMNEVTQLLCNIGKLIAFHRIFMPNSINNEQNQIPDMITRNTIMLLHNNIKKLTTLLLKNYTYYKIIEYIVYRLNLGMLRDHPTSVEEIKKIMSLNLLFNKNNLSQLIVNKTNTVPNISVQKSSQSRSITDKEIPRIIGTQETRNTNLRMRRPNQATVTTVDEQRFQNSTNNAASMLQQRQNTVNSNQHQIPSNMNYIPQTPQLDPTITNTNLSRFSNNVNIPSMPQTNPSSTTINWQQSSGNTFNTLNPPQSKRIALNTDQRYFSDSINNILRIQQPGVTTENIERQQSSNSTNSIPIMSQSSPITIDMKRQRLSASTNNNSPRIPQPSSATGNVEQPRSSANTNNTLCTPQSSPATVNSVQQSSDSTNNIPRVSQSSPATENIEQRQSSANMNNIQYVTNSDLNNAVSVPGTIPLSDSMATRSKQQQFLRNNPYISHVLNTDQRATIEKYQRLNRLVGFQLSGNTSNIPHVPHSGPPVLNTNQTSQSTNVTVHDVRQPLRDMLNQQQIYPGCLECRNFYMPLPGTKNVTLRPSYPGLRTVNSLPTNAIISDNIRQEQGRESWMASLGNNSKGIACVPNAQQANFQQRSSGSVQNTMPSCTGMVLTAGNAPNVSLRDLLNPQTQTRQPYQKPPLSYNTHAYFIPNSPIIPSNTQQSVIPSNAKTQERKYNRKVNPAKARQEVPENLVFSGKCIPQNFATGAGAPVVSLVPSQEKATLPGYTRETPVSSARSSAQAARDASAKHADASATSNSSNNPSNSESRGTAQSTPTKSAQGLSQSAAKTTNGFKFNLNIFTAIQKFIIQSQLDTYFRMSSKVTVHMLPKQQRRMWKSDRSLLRCFGDSLQKYMSKLQKQAGELTQEDEARSLLPRREQEECAGQSRTELRRGEGLEIIRYLKDVTKPNASMTESTPEDSSTRPQDEQPLGTSNSSKSAATEAPSAGVVESPQRNEDASTLRPDPSPLLEESNAPPEDPDASRQDSSTETRDGAELDGTAQSIKQKSAEQPSIDAEMEKSSTDKCKEKLSLGAQQERSDQIFVGKDKPNIRPADVMQHEPEKLENLSEDIEIVREYKSDIRLIGVIEREPEKLEYLSEDIEINQTELAEQPSTDTEIKQSSIDRCKEKPSSDVQQEQCDEIIVGEYESDKRPIDMMQHALKKLEDLSGDIIEINQIEPAEQPSTDTEIKQILIDKFEEKPSSDAQQEQRDVTQHKPEKLEDLSEDIIEINQIEPAEQPSIDTEIKQSSADKCKEKSSSGVQQEQRDEIFVGEYESDIRPVDVIQRVPEKLENLSENVIETKPTDLYLCSPDAEIVNERLMLKEKKEQVEEIFQDFKISERRWYTEEYGQWEAQPIDTLTLSDDEEKWTTRLTGSELGNEQLDHSSELEHLEVPQALLAKKKEINNANIYDDIIIEDDILAENNVVTYNVTEIEDLEVENTLNILSICSISPTLYENMSSSTLLAQDDALQVLDEKEDRELSNLENNLEIVDEKDVPCLRCKQPSTVCCENCLAAYYCSERCSKLHWFSSHYKYCKPYNRDLPDRFA